MILPFGEWKPDLSSYIGTTSQLALNVVPRADGYGPFKAFAPYSQALAAGNDAFTKVLLHFDGADASTTITDSNAGGSAHTWTAASNAQIDTAQSVFGGSSGLFDGGAVGGADTVSTPDHVDFTRGSGPWTIDFRFRNASVGIARNICGQVHSSGSAALSAFEVRRTAANVLEAKVYVGSTTYTVTGTTVTTAGVWYHGRVVRTGDILKLFLNGVQEGGDVAISGAVNDSAAKYVIGDRGEASGAAWDGWVDEYCDSIGIARSTGNFTPPATAYVSGGACRGFFYARKTDGSIVVFAGTAARLFRLNNTDFSWTDVSKGGLAYSALTSSDHWQFAQFGNLVVAVQANTVPQLFDISSASAFSDLGGSPPQARYVAVVGRFLVLSGLLSNPFRIQWSGLNAITTWTAGVNSSDSQDLPDGGIVRGVAGGEYGVIFQDTAMRRMVYVPGSPVIFNIERITEDKGLMAAYSLIRAGDKIFWLAAQGFHGMTSTGVPEEIGKERFDRTFFADYDSGSLQLIIGAADPEQSRVYWAYKSQAGAAGLFDKVLCYDYALGRAAVISLMGEYLATLGRPGLTLESLDTISGSVDALTFSLDDISVAALSKLAVVDGAHKLGFCTGDNLEAALDTSEQTLDRRVRVKGLRPITDAATCYGSVGARETLQAAVSYSAEQAVNGRGLCPANVSTRLARGRLRIPAATSWTFATGLEPEFAQEGKR